MTAGSTASAHLLGSLAYTSTVDLGQPCFAGLAIPWAKAPNHAFMLQRRHERGLESWTSAVVATGSPTRPVALIVEEEV